MSVESKFVSRELNHQLWKVAETVSTAESCTGGAVASALTSIPGSSNYFKGGIIAYTEEDKVKFLDVNPETLEKYTVYSEEVAKEMVAGAIKQFGTTYAVAVTGVAGPTGGTPEIPVGTVWIAVGDAQEIVTKKRTVDEGRQRNIDYAVADALQMLLDFVEARHPEEQSTETE